MNPRSPTFRRRPFSILPALLVLNIIIFFIDSPDGMKFAGNLTPSFSLGADHIRQLQFWRFITYMFVHGDFYHLLFNMWGLWLFGRSLESVIGFRRFLQLYFFSGFLGGAAFLAIEWGSGTGCVGASAGVFGVLVGTALLFPNSRIMLLFPPIPMTLKVFAFVYMGLEFFMGVSNYNSGIAHMAHVGGGLAGFLYLAVLSFYRPELYPLRDRLQLLWWKLFKGRKMRGKLKDTRHYPRPMAFPETPDYQPTPPPLVSRDDIDQLLDKAEKHGVESLTEDEKNTLLRAKNFFTASSD